MEIITGCDARRAGVVAPGDRVVNLLIKWLAVVSWLDASSISIAPRKSRALYVNKKKGGERFRFLVRKKFPPQKHDFMLWFMQKHSFMFSFPLWHWEFACLMRLNCQQGWKVGTKWHWSNAPTKKKKKKTWSSFFSPILCLFYFPRLFFIFFCRNEVSSFFFSSRLDVKDSFFPISLQKKLIIFLVGSMVTK